MERDRILLAVCRKASTRKSDQFNIWSSANKYRSFDHICPNSSVMMFFKGEMNVCDAKCKKISYEVRLEVIFSKTPCFKW
ncbi:hypothetical protein AHF37_04603 [Paragonimus kellicotti]|nr:hypothetical protein AHF37_04603 [Paragonimus kellicotti]